MMGGGWSVGRALQPHFGCGQPQLLGWMGDNKTFGHYLTLDEHSTKDQY